MISFLEYIFSDSLRKEIFISIFTMLVLIIYSYVFLRYYKSVKIQRRERKEIFSKALVKGLKNSAIDSMEDLINIYSGVYRGFSVESRNGLSNSLREFLVELISGNLEEDLDDKAIHKWKEKINGFIVKNDELSPFSELPNTERNIFNDILSFLELEDKKSAKRKLDELSNLIINTKQYVTKLETSNKWSVPLSIVGLILTVIFGLISLF